MMANSLQGALFSFGLVILALAVTRWWKIPVQKDISLGSVRAFIQLLAVGYVLRYVFDMASVPLTLVVISVMLLVGAWVAAGSSSSSGSAGSVGSGRSAFLLCLVAMTLGSIVTLGLLLLAGIIDADARYIIPLGGMIISNSMNASSLTLNRLNSDIASGRQAIETSLSLGQTWREASLKFQKQAAIAGMISILNFLKTVGLVALPGAMTGMILAGAEPVKAVYLQVVVAFMLVSAVTITSVVTLELAIRRHFTPHHQLR